MAQLFSPSQIAERGPPRPACMLHLPASLDGYPALALIETCTCTQDPQAASCRRARWFADEVMKRWDAILASDIAGIPTPCVDALAAIRTEMLATRDALRQARGGLEAVDGTAPSGSLPPSTAMQGPVAA